MGGVGIEVLFRFQPVSVHQAGEKHAGEKMAGECVAAKFRRGGIGERGEVVGFPGGGVGGFLAETLLEVSVVGEAGVMSGDAPGDDFGDCGLGFCPLVHGFLRAESGMGGRFSGSVFPAEVRVAEPPLLEFDGVFSEVVEHPGGLRHFTGAERGAKALSAFADFFQVFAQGFGRPARHRGMRLEFSCHQSAIIQNFPILAFSRSYNFAFQRGGG